MGSLPLAVTVGDPGSGEGSILSSLSGDPSYTQGELFHLPGILKTEGKKHPEGKKQIKAHELG